MLMQEMTNSVIGQVYEEFLLANEQTKKLA